jgi:hypothetical protein
MAETQPGAAVNTAEETDRPATFNDVIGGSDVATQIADETAEDSLEDVAAVAATHPELEPIQGGDVSDTPAAQPGSHGEVTGADTGTGAEVGITRPGGMT